MKISRFLSHTIVRVLAASIASFSLFSCKDKDDDKKLSDDPRIRRVVFDEFSNYEFIVNDYEAVIYNYDSLPYGTRIDSLMPYIFGYANTDINVGVQMDESGVIAQYQNNFPLNFTTPVSIVSTSQDGKHNKTYSFEVRVHKYDVDAFEWSETDPIDLQGSTIISEKSFTIAESGAKERYLWFVQTDEGYFLFENNGDKWSRQDIASSAELNFETLALLGDTLFVADSEGSVFKTDIKSLSFEKTELGGETSVQTILYALDGKLWYISRDSLFAYSNGKIAVRNSLPQDFSLLNLKTFTAASGYTTLGYVYTSETSGVKIWSIDRYGNTVCLSKNALPSLASPIVFCYGETLGLIGGIDESGRHSNKCYISKNSGVAWSSDWHKDFSANVGSLTKAGVFVTSNKGELLIVGGMSDKGISNKVFSGRLKKLKQEEEFINSLK